MHLYARLAEDQDGLRAHVVYIMLARPEHRGYRSSQRVLQHARALHLVLAQSEYRQGKLGSFHVMI